MPTPEVCPSALLLDSNLEEVPTSAGQKQSDAIQLQVQARHEALLSLNGFAFHGPSSDSTTAETL